MNRRILFVAKETEPSKNKLFGNLIEKGMDMRNAYDPSAAIADELLSYFARNTAIKIEHKFMGNTLEVKSARTGNVIATVVRDKGIYTVDEQFDFFDLRFVATFISGMRRFPKPKNTKKAWSPVRLSAASIKLMESDSGIRFA